jgi:hypothetical protein
VNGKRFSNIEGIRQIRFSKGNIRESFGDVLATPRREFGSGSRSIVKNDVEKKSRRFRAERSSREERN